MNRKSRTGWVSPRRRRSRCGAVQPVDPRRMRIGEPRPLVRAEARKDGLHPPQRRRRPPPSRRRGGAAAAPADLQRALGRRPVLPSSRPTRSRRWVTVLTCTPNDSAARPGSHRPGSRPAGAHEVGPPLRVVVQHRREGGRDEARTSRPSPTSRPKNPSSSALPAVSPRPSATRSPRTGPPRRAPVRWPPPVCRSAAADGHRPGAGLRQLAVHGRRRRAGPRSGRQTTTQPSCRPASPPGGGQVRRGQRAPGARLDPGHGDGQRAVEVGTRRRARSRSPSGSRPTT